MLDRTQDDIAEAGAASAHPARPIRPWSRFGRVMARAARAVVNRSFSSLTRRIVLLNLVGLVALVSGILWLSQFRQGLIESRAQSLLVQGEIIAGALKNAWFETTEAVITPGGGASDETLVSDADIDTYLECPGPGQPTLVRDGEISVGVVESPGITGETSIFTLQVRIELSCD